MHTAQKELARKSIIFKIVSLTIPAQIFCSNSLRSVQWKLFPVRLRF